MPKVYLDKKKKLNDRFYGWLNGQMKLKGISQNAIASELGLSQQLFSYRLSNQKFLATDLLAIINYIQPDTEEIIFLMGLKGS